MNGTLGGAWKIGSVMGIPIRLHFTWFLVFGLITWSLSTVYFPQAAPDLPALAYWIKGALASLLLFASVAFHELAHSFVARRYGIPIESITLFIFGGVAQMKSEPPHPRAEFWIAVAGPLSSFFLAVLFLYGTLQAEGGVRALFSYLARINFILGAFNLIPGFPMDGGRVLRSFLWKRKNNYFYATQKASGSGRRSRCSSSSWGSSPCSRDAGRDLAHAHRLVPVHRREGELPAGGDPGDPRRGQGAAHHGEGPGDDSLLHLPRRGRERVFPPVRLRGFPVVDDGKYLGMLTLKELKDVPRETTRVSAVYAPHRAEWEVTPDEDAVKALERMIRSDVGRLVVAGGGRIEGMITRSGLARYVQLMGRSGGVAGWREMEA